MRAIPNKRVTVKKPMIRMSLMFNIVESAVGVIMALCRYNIKQENRHCIEHVSVLINNFAPTYTYNKMQVHVHVQLTIINSTTVSANPTT